VMLHPAQTKILGPSFCRTQAPRQPKSNVPSLVASAATVA
jgi:hypothetical protein